MDCLRGSEKERDWIFVSSSLFRSKWKIMFVYAVINGALHEIARMQ